MAGSSFGNILRITTFGESHGPALGVVLDGVPPRIPISLAEIQKELERRKPGQSSYSTARAESDQVEILSGWLEGVTTGTPLALLIRNQDQKSADYAQLKDVFRPGHADLTYWQKFGIRDWRGGGRASGRETAARVAAGVIARKILAPTNLQITAYTLAIGGIYAQDLNLEEIEKNPLRCPDAKQAELMAQALDQAKAAGDSLGGIIEARVRNCPAGLGAPVFDKLEARLAAALMSLGAVKGVEIGAGFKVAEMRGSACNDVLYSQDKTILAQTNNAGGILGGISTGAEIVLRIAVKPTPSIALPQITTDSQYQNQTIEIHGRHDPCICPRLVPVVEAMIALTLADFWLAARAQA